MFGNYFNNESVRKLVIAFGSLFNNIHIDQLNKDGSVREYTVPLTYAPKEKYIKRITQASSISNRTRVEISVPQMAFEMTDIVYDPVRKLNKMLYRTSGATGATYYSAYSEVPYNFTFGLYAYTRNIEENLQIMEKILPFFTPEFVVTLNMTALQKKVDVPISLIKTVFTQEYEGDFSTRRAVISTYQFVAKSYIFGPVKSETNIANTGIYRSFDLSLFDNSEKSDGITMDIPLDGAWYGWYNF